jgi:hypothetical protein
MIAKRPRGRPRGSGKNDRPYLEKIADLLLRDPSLTPTTAMKRIIRGKGDWDASDETLIRRWQVKWKEQSDSLMTAARERAQPKPSAPIAPSWSPFLLSGDAMRSLREIECYARALFEVDLSPTIRAIKEFDNSSVMRAMRALENSPWMKMTSEPSALATIGAFERSVSQATASLAAFERQIQDVRLMGVPIRKPAQ